MKKREMFRILENDARGGREVDILRSHFWSLGTKNNMKIIIGLNYLLSCNSHNLLLSPIRFLPFYVAKSKRTHTRNLKVDINYAY